ncbi:MAG: MFS transporter [Mesorhizobium sp.]|uniref:MFS transporter n=1 Tax=Mesorhizobium sp. TaxID=1871066 RepID=UPI000FE7D4AB|nr:MFS transporter [Mesorhizobium sp.]RWE81168.1 MAG: MFS transporter [Mesorhizobium sp.]TIT09315.1 MAG: MFS transporter [Mesorhizobium sp.]TJW62092.1 MAG: MFS transporter [Mesorhizobium sp.]
MKPSLIALAAGAFAIGTTEFVIIGLVPGIGRDLGITLPAAGLLVSGYALAVTAGAPTVTALVGHLPRRPLAVGLMLLFALGNLLSGFASGYGAMLAGRIIVPLGLPNRESPRTGISVLWFRPCRPEQEGGGESCGDSEMARTGFRRPAARPQAAVKGYASPAPRTALRKRRSEGSISTSATYRAVCRVVFGSQNIDRQYRIRGHPLPGTASQLKRRTS